MPDQISAPKLVGQARDFFCEVFCRDLGPLVGACMEALHQLNEQPAERQVAQQRRDMLHDLASNGAAWPGLIKQYLSKWQHDRTSPSTSSALPVLGSNGAMTYELVDDDTIQRSILTSRLSLAIIDQATWEFADLRARVTQPFGVSDLDPDDLFRPQILARCLIRAWIDAGLSLATWRGIEDAVQRACARHSQSCYQATNEWLVEHGSVPEVDLRALIRRSDGTPAEGKATPSPTAPAPLPAEAAEPIPALHAGPHDGARAAVAGLGAALGAFITKALPASLTGTRSALPLADAGAPGIAAGAGVADPALLARWSALMRGLSGGPSAGAQAAGVGVGASFSSDASTDGTGASGAAAGGGVVGGGAGGNGSGGGGGPLFSGGWLRFAGGGTGGVAPGGALDEETRLMTRQPGQSVPGELVVQRLSDLLERQVPGFRDAGGGGVRVPSLRLSQAMAQVQQRHEQQATLPADVVDPAVPLVQELKAQTQALKQAADTPNERATIELVALMFQNILTEDRIPSGLRVWFARLQMPTLRVALAEPDFFTSPDHPARRLIDRMGGCVMGFEGASDTVGEALEAEIRRVVQVIEAFPDTGRRVFKTVLREFEKFLEKYYREQNAASRTGVSLAQQIEQRETLAIQYTIELRKSLADVPTHEGVRDFLFHVWADVLATKAVRHGPNSEDVKRAREAAIDLMWVAAAKTNADERAEVIQRLPALLGTLRQGMGLAGLDAERQRAMMAALGEALTVAFGARTPSLDPQQLEQLKHRLAAIEEILPDEDFELDDSWVLDESNHQQDGLEIVAEGGSMPNPAHVKLATELGLGSGFTLEYRGRRDLVRLAWQGMHRQLTLFVTTEGRCLLFQKARLAAFLQAGLLLPIQDEPLTASATRKAMHRIQEDPRRLTSA